MTIYVFNTKYVYFLARKGLTEALYRLIRGYAELNSVLIPLNERYSL